MYRMGSEQSTSNNAVTTTIARLEEELRNITAEINSVTDALGEAVIRSDDAEVESLEMKLDTLSARHLGLSAEIRELQRTADSSGTREQRRAEAAARIRRELAASEAELYEGWATLLEHRARIAELRQELDRLESTQPVQMSRMDEIEQRLTSKSRDLDLSLKELDESRDGSRMRSVAKHYRTKHYRTLASDAQRAAQEAEHRAKSDTVQEAVPVVSTMVNGSISGRHEHKESAEEAESPSLESRTRAAAVAPSRPTSEKRVGDGETSYQEAEEQLLRALKNTISERGDPMRVGAEVDDQLASIEARRTERAGAAEQRSGLDSTPADDGDASSWRRHLGFGRLRQ
jgi:hypothetical protein